jgi:hypothetical protein
MNPARRLSRGAIPRRTELIPFYSLFAAQSSLVANEQRLPASRSKARCRPKCRYMAWALYPLDDVWCVGMIK